jgi:hypothetical protein
MLVTIVAPLNSSAIVQARFTPDDDEAAATALGTLEITFTSGETYSFDAVPQTVFEGLRKADSPGKFYHQNIKDQY